MLREVWVGNIKGIITEEPPDNALKVHIQALSIALVLPLQYL